MGNCPARQNFLHPMTQTMCCGITGSPDPLGFSAASWEHYSPGLTGFFWKMSPASDESESCFSAACPVLRMRRRAVLCWGSHRHLTAVVWTEIFLLRKESLSLPAHGQAGLPGAGAGRGAGSWWPWDRQTHLCYSTLEPGLQLGSLAKAFPLLLQL